MNSCLHADVEHAHTHTQAHTKRADSSLLIDMSCVRRAAPAAHADWSADGMDAPQLVI